jgi:ribosomal protein S18 acetylase RimI-like enzyme
MRRMLANLAGPGAFAVVEQAGAAVACGLAIAHAGTVGFFDIATHPAHRRRGHGRRLMRDLMAWGCAHGARTGYLQVTTENAPARALYAGLGFREVHPYWYRMR